MALRDMTWLVYAYQSMRLGRPARSELGNQEMSYDRKRTKTEGSDACFIHGIADGMEKWPRESQITESNRKQLRTWMTRSG